MEQRKRKKPSGIRQKFLKRMQKKLVLLFGIIILAFIGLIVRVTYINATNGYWDVYLTPTKSVPHDWIGNIKDKKI